MTLITPESKLSQVILSNEPSIVTVINRFGISLGVGDASIAEICAQRNIDKDFFTAILNTYTNEDYFPQRILSSSNIHTLINYLFSTNAYYEHFLLPNVERHFNLLVSRAKEPNGNIALMLQFFNEVQQEIASRIHNDRTSLFPAIMAGNAHCATPQQLMDIDANIEDKISDLVNMLVVHFSGDYDQNLGLAVYITIHDLKKDISNDNRIRKRILYPLYLSNNRTTAE